MAPVPRYAAATPVTLRFVMFTKQSPTRTYYYRIFVAEMDAYSAEMDAYSAQIHIPFGTSMETGVKQVLLKTKYLSINEGGDEDNSPCVKAFQRAERVVKALNNMDLAIQAAELEPNGIKNLFDQLWSSDL